MAIGSGTNEPLVSGTPTAPPAPPTRDGPGARAISAGTLGYGGVYSRDTDGEYVGQSAVWQRVIIACKLVELPKYMDQSFTVRAQNAVRAALITMTDVERVLRVNRLTVTKSGTMGAVIDIDFTDLTTGKTPPPVRVQR